MRLRRKRKRKEYRVYFLWSDRLLHGMFCIMYIIKYENIQRNFLAISEWALETLMNYFAH
nr:unnamed protein product [Callosobruchus analis]